MGSAVVTVESNPTWVGAPYSPRDNVSVLAMAALEKAVPIVPHPDDPPVDDAAPERRGCERWTWSRVRALVGAVLRLLVGDESPA